MKNIHFKTDQTVLLHRERSGVWHHVHYKHDSLCELWSHVDGSLRP